MNETGQRIRPNFKPDWSPELLAGCMYFGHLFAAAASWSLRRAGSGMGSKALRTMTWRCDLAGSGASVKHVARVLYHWRMHEGSTAAEAGAKPYAHVSGKHALWKKLCAQTERATRCKTGRCRTHT